MPYAAPLSVATAGISDFDGEAGVAIQSITPGGVWMMDRDMSPGGVGSMTVEPCGTTGNGLRFRGSGFTMWGVDVGAAIVSQTQPVDVSAYRGISFVLKSATLVPVLFKVQNPYSQPQCGRCYDLNPLIGEECYSGYTKYVTTTVGPFVQQVFWEQLTQQSWGYRPPGSFRFDPSNLVSLAFALEQSAGTFDICIDDVKFIQ